MKEEPTEKWKESSLGDSLYLEIDAIHRYLDESTK